MTIVYKNQHYPAIGGVEEPDEASSELRGDEQLHLQSIGYWI